MFSGLQQDFDISKARNELGFNPKSPEQAVKEALDYLGHVYKKECVNANWSNNIQKQLTWVANCIIHLYYQKATQDK